MGWSPSTRREWIEIGGAARHHAGGHRLPPHGGSGLKYGESRRQSRFGRVSLHTEGVD